MANQYRIYYKNNVVYKIKKYTYDLYTTHVEYKFVMRAIYNVLQF